ncbi:multidrug effflux MFS transporter [Fructilactobacillus fructivorans]|uniref:Bcr/CflA family efflux transporter n=1 Tax=Fructilactobacillus fructivorans TaxID=1614 RepID=A0AAE6P1Y2_9LACO|nr:multidrug effflux MFS transporter [Fructilactobacillus fructivorans]KRK56913.1 Bcr CflA subfamily drug resistance transporter [Fructilactobacillus fructivorans]KRN41222.1 Bcr CflA subfamily drug resistance transporter [Fructilactobacillus fructivorans]KRN43037.1 Bcr CflA subfamily drug resistance transporter [Fructilactobacillus fructivorans]QFX93235.1 Bcr/CflA family efflux MFS transporter [Fructilactobacillus fructivorans]RDV65055.1 MFS transporter [Fructilactobacillus fructivorans]
METKKSHIIWLAVLLGIVSATGPLSMDLYMPALPQMMATFHTNASMMQLSITACLIGLAVGQVIIGPLSDRYGRKPLLIIGFLLFALSSTMIAFIPNIYALISLRLVQGIAGATGQVISRAVARDMFEGKILTRFYSLLTAVNGIFPIIAPIFGGLIIKITDWQGIFMILGVIGIIIVLMCIFGIPETLSPDNRSTGSLFQSEVQMFHLLKDPKFFRLVLATGLVYGSLFSYISSSSFVFQSQFHMSVTDFSFLYAINGVAIGVGSALPGRLVMKTDSIKLLKEFIKATIVASLILTLSAIWFKNLLIVMILVFIILLFIGALLTLSTTVAMNAADRNAGSASALVGLTQNAMGGIVSPLVGIMGENTYLPMGLIILIAMVLINMLLVKPKRVKK